MPASTALSAGRHRLTLLVILIAAGAAGLGLGLTLAPLPTAEPELQRLLRGMVVIKGLIALAAAALLWRRLGRPITGALASRYGLWIGLCAAALGWLWALHLLLAGSLVFYAGLGGLLLTARRDPLLCADRPACRAERD